MEKNTLLEKMYDLVATDKKNTYKNQYRIYDSPLVGFADAHDPIFQDFKDKNIIGPIFKAPTEWLPEAKTVISFFLPFTKKVRTSNYDQGIASDEWMHGRFVGEAFVQYLGRQIVQLLKDSDFKALAPNTDPSFQSDFTTYTSNWSERHIAYAAGLGTFSLNRGLITEKGMAGRFGSVITDSYIIPSPRPYSDPFENCLFTREGKCGECIKRCPSHSITKEGKNKYTCHQYLFTENPRKEFNKTHGYPYSACGKCLTNVPCETKIP
jgi:epoxyqueuosine reductase QueG